MTLRGARSSSADTTTIAGAPPAASSKPVPRPPTGAEYLDSLRDDREIWIYGERVRDVTTHPAFRNSARSVARMYDALHEAHANGGRLAVATESGGFTHPFFRVPYTPEDMEVDRDAIATWQRMAYGYMGRSPDYKACFLATLRANADYYDPYQANAERWYRETQDRALYLNHAIVHPPIDRSRPADESPDVCVHVVRETDAGPVVSGAKVVATASALTHYNFVAHFGLPVKKQEFAVVFVVPIGAPGVKLFARHSYEMVAAHMGSPFDYPLSSRLDENDSILVLDEVLVPWENLFIYRDVEKANGFFPRSGMLPRALFHGCIRFAVKLDFLCGLMLKAAEVVGNAENRNVQVALGEMLALRGAFWGLTEGMIRRADPWIGGALLPGFAEASAYRILSTQAYGRMKELVEQTFGSSLIYLNSNAVDFATPDVAKYLERYVRGSNGTSAVERVKILKCLWDGVASEFGGRHELYERNYSGNVDETRVQTLMASTMFGTVDALKGFAGQCLAEYDLDGWRVPGYVNPDDVNVFRGRS